MQQMTLDPSTEPSLEPMSEPAESVADHPIARSLKGLDTRLDSSQEGNEHLHEKLFDSLVCDCSDPSGRSRFLPLDVQEDSINVNSVRRELVRSKSIGDSELDELVSFICFGRPNGPGSLRGKKLFAILVLLGIDQLDTILAFKQEGITDFNLPFRRDERNELRPGNYAGSLDFFDSWSQKMVREFEDYQWSTMAPVLQPQSLGSLDDRIILPWTQYTHTAEGGHSNVYKVEIHDSHHSFPKREASKGRTCFALKELKSKEPSIFCGECDSFRKFGQHQHLTELLASFQHKGRYYLLFPWAYGGTLKDLWMKGDAKPGYVDTQWVAQQAYGLVDGLFRVHYVKSDPQSIEAALDRGHQDNDKIFGRHGDIKRDNVLLFQSELRNEGVLKLSDFGLTVYHSTMSRSTDRPGSGRPCGLEYRAPEAEAERSDNRMSPRYDIWCLGCLYLDMVTWLLLGSKGLKEFLDNRLREKIWPACFDTEYFWKSKKGPRGSQGPPVVKSSVKYVSNLLLCLMSSVSELI
ncbi:protein kinase [Apiospora arundinis]|uniref:Protein kinase n=1 Tax=Apiospora arundinis TaxID=335852 RepID=A0ABR2I024_9PEZI